MKCPAVLSISERDLSAPLPLLLRWRQRGAAAAPTLAGSRDRLYLSALEVFHGNAVRDTAVRRRQACSPPSPSMSLRPLQTKFLLPPLSLPADTWRGGPGPAVLELKPLPVASNSCKNNQTQRAC